MKKLLLCLIIIFIFVFQKSRAQPCPMKVGYNYTIYIFSYNSNFSFKELLDGDINPMLVHVIHVKDEASKMKVDVQCLTGKMATSIFIYPSNDPSKTLRFCNQQEYADALKNHTSLQLQKE